MRWFAKLALCTLFCFIKADRLSYQYRSHGVSEIEAETITEVLERLNPLKLRAFFLQTSKDAKTQCQVDWNTTLNASPQNALKYWSSFAVPWTGIAGYKTLFIGQPEQCTNAKIDLTAVKVASFPATKPFLLNIPFMEKLNITTGICMPASCSNAEVQEIFDPLFEEFRVKITVTSRSNFEADWGFYIACVIYAILFSLVATGTSLAAYRHYAEKYERASSYISLDEDNDVEEWNADTRVKTANGTIVTRPTTDPKNDSLVVKILLCFNFYANFLKIIAAPKQDGSQLSVLNGIRTMSLGWVVIAHMFLHELETGVQDNPLYLVKLVKHFLFQPFANASLSVDSFFVLSGMLVMMGTLKALEKRRSSVQFWIMFYVHRFIRLWPALLLTILFIVGFYPLLAEAFYSPLFQTDTKSAISNQCRGTNWITVALFVNNYVDINDPDKKPCMTWTWYLADDMQFYAVSPLFVIATKYSRKAGIGLISLCVLISTLANIGYSAAKDIYAFGNPLAVIETKNFNEKWIDNMYEWPWMRFQIYGIGLLLGIVMHEQDRIKRKFHSLSLNTRIVVIIGLWFYALIAAGVAVYGCYPSVNGHFMGRGASAMYNATFRVLWSTALAVLIILCAWGYGGALNRALGSNFWVPFARVGYTAYIIHVVLLWLWLNSAETTIRLTTINIAIQFSGIVTLVYCVAIVWSCLIEAPFIQVEKLIFAR